MPLDNLPGIEGGYACSDIVDIAAFSRMLDQLFAATGIPNGVVDADGDILCQAGRTDACARMQAFAGDVCPRCRTDRFARMAASHDGEVTPAKCPHGLIDYTRPVVIGGRPLATLVVGPVLDAAPDSARLGQQAARFGDEAAAYVAAVRAVPVVSAARAGALLDCMLGMAQTLAENGLVRMHQTVLLRDLTHSTEQRIELEDILDSSPVGIGWSTVERKIEYVNNRFTQLFGYTREDIPDLDAWYHKAYPDPTYREAVIEPWHRAVVAAREAGTPVPALEADVTCKDGSGRRVLIQISWVGDKRLVHFGDMTAHWRSERRNRAHDAMLEMVARGAPLADILHSIVRAIEFEDPKALCSVLLLDEQGRHLLTGAAPSLPAFYNDAVDGIEIGEGVGSCGTAARLGERVIVERIDTHEYWQPYAALARQAGLAACWSEPILSSAGKVLGTFAIYHAQPATPGAEDLDRIGFAANLAAIAIETRNAREALVARERAFRSLAENAPDNIARYDLTGRLIYLNPRMEETLGMPAAQLLGKRPGECAGGDRFAQYEAGIRRVATTGEAILREFDMPHPTGMSCQAVHMVAERDDAGVITGVLAIGRDVTERKRMERELEHQAHFDFLTGLANRRHFIELANAELARFRRYGGALSLIMFDIDHFKRVNDTHGHNAGDLVLKRIGELCRATLRDPDIVGRIGGEEFAVLLPQTDRHQAMGAAERLRAAIATAPIKAPGEVALTITASFGLVIATRESADIDGLLIQADQALYLAKEKGRNRICVAGQPC